MFMLKGEKDGDQGDWEVVLLSGQRENLQHKYTELFLFCRVVCFKDVTWRAVVVPN